MGLFDVRGEDFATRNQIAKAAALTPGFVNELDAGAVEKLKQREIELLVKQERENRFHMVIKVFGRLLDKDSSDVAATWDKAEEIIGHIVSKAESVDVDIRYYDL